MIVQANLGDWLKFNVMGYLNFENFILFSI